MVIKKQLEKYLNKQVVIREKIYNMRSTEGVVPGHKEIEGILPDFDDEFVELDNKALINRNFIYRISLK